MSSIKNKNFLAIIIFVFLAIFVLAFFIIPLLNDEADETPDYSYHIENYNITYKFKDDRTFNVQEEITAVFNVSGKHGIIRDLPINSGEIYKNIECNVSADISQYGMSFLSIRLGDEDFFITPDSEITYKISYDLRIPTSKGKDILYLNVIGAGWSTTIKKADIQVILPDKPVSDVLVNTSDFHGDYNLSDNLLQIQVENLNPFTPVTFKAQLPEGTMGTFSPDSSEWIAVSISVLLLIATVVFVLVIPYETITPVVNFTSPNDMDPLLMGAMIDGSVQQGDITSLIYYWANKHLLDIDFSDPSDPVLIKKGDLPGNAPSYQTVIFNKIFSYGNAVKISSMTNTFYSAAGMAKAQVSACVPSIYKKNFNTLSTILAVVSCIIFAAILLLSQWSVGNSFTSFIPFIGIVFFPLLYFAGYFSVANAWKFSKKARLGIFIGQVALLILFTVLLTLLLPQTYLFKWITAISAFALGGVALSAPYIKRRRADYIALMNPVLGFREFISLAEKERLEMLLEENPEYYYNILPYAQVLGVSDIWEDKFKDLNIEAPSWAVNRSSTVFNFIAFNALLRSANRSMSTTFTSRPAPSGKSGGGRSSGGGFSGGGGFGGGGGRSW